MPLPYDCFLELTHFISRKAFSRKGAKEQRRKEIQNKPWGFGPFLCFHFVALIHTTLRLCFFA